METVKVRIAVTVNSHGDWYAYGHPVRKERDEQEVMDMTIDGIGEKVGPEANYWVTAHLTVPTAGEVHASDVERADVKD